MIRFKCDVFPVQPNGTFIGKEVSGNGIEQGGFAGAVGTEDRNIISFFHMEGNTVQRFLLIHTAGIKDLGDCINFQHITALPFFPWLCSLSSLSG